MYGIDAFDIIRSLIFLQEETQRQILLMSGKR
jgi:hypothetical protein